MVVSLTMKKFDTDLYFIFYFIYFFCSMELKEFIEKV